MRSFFLALSTLLLLGGNAFASGGIWCETEATLAKIDVHSGVTRGMGGPLFNFEAKVAIADKTVPDDLRNVEFRQEHVPQYWFDGDQLKLLLYREREADKPHGYVEISIETKAREGDDGEGSYDGTYRLSVFDGTDESAEPKRVELSAAISCSAD